MLSKYKYWFLSFLAILIACSCNPKFRKNSQFDASRLNYGNTPEQVIKIIGVNPDTAFNKTILGKEYYILFFYKKDSSEFRFDNNKLSEVIVNKPVLPFSSSSITQFGLSLQEPTQTDSTAFIVWRGTYDNFDVVNFYLTGSRKTDNSVSYKIYFKLKKEIV